MNNYLIIVSQRMIELLAFYFILANINGKDLKESIARLVKMKQEKVLYGNILLLIVYPIAMAFIYQLFSGYGFLIDHLLRPFVACLLLRLYFDLKKTLFTYIISIFIGVIVSFISFAFQLDHTIVNTLFLFLLFLLVIVIFCSQNYFENIYVRLVKRNRLLNIILILSIGFFFLPLLTDSNIIFEFVLATISSLIIFTIFILLKQEANVLTEQLKNATSNEIFDVLKAASTQYIQTDLLHQYLIKNYKVMDIIPVLSKELDAHKILNTFRDYECIVTKRQIKINVIL